jgi:hypothetical protein
MVVQPVKRTGSMSRLKTNFFMVHLGRVHTSAVRDPHPSWSRQDSNSSGFVFGLEFSLPMKPQSVLAITGTRRCGILHNLLHLPFYTSRSLFLLTCIDLY